jgi:recombination protein RecT
MSDTPQDGHYDSSPGARKVAVITTWQEFEGELQERESAIASMLPSNINLERFKNTAIAAVKQNPELLECTPRSLFQAITRSAQDGILPDGREGVIGIYNTKVKKRGGGEVWEKQANWNPMTFGLRKRARELDGLLIDAQVVHEKDYFKQHQGDDPKIEHEPAPLGTKRGKMVGAYAIFKRENGVIVAREVMDDEAIETVREQSKQPDGLMWRKFQSEAWRKTVARRGFKSVPVSEGLQQILQRDDEANFDFHDEPKAAALVPPPAPSVSKEPPAIEQKQPLVLPGDWQDYIDVQRGEFVATKSPQDKQAVIEAVTDAIQGSRERGEISEPEAELITDAWTEICEAA